MKIEILNHIVHVWNVMTAIGTLAHVLHVENSPPEEHSHIEPLTTTLERLYSQERSEKKLCNILKTVLGVWHAFAHLSLFLAFIYNKSSKAYNHLETHKSSIEDLICTTTLYTRYYSIFSLLCVYIPLVSVDMYNSWSKISIKNNLYKSYTSLIKFILFLNPVRDWVILESVIYIENKQLQKKHIQNRWISEVFDTFMNSMQTPNKNSIHIFKLLLHRLDPAIITPIIKYRHKDYLEFLDNYWSKELAECYRENYHTSKKDLQQLCKQLPLAFFNKPLTLCIESRQTNVVKKLVIPASVSDHIKSYLCLMDLQCLSDPFLTQSTVVQCIQRQKANPQNNLFNTLARSKESATTLKRYNPKPQQRQCHEFK